MPDWSVVIPVYREREIQPCLDRLAAIAAGRDVEVVVSGSDGGWTRERILRPIPNLSVIDAPKGRGQQIASGIRASSAERILVLHADSELPDRAFDLMDRVLARRAAGSFLLGVKTKNPLLAISSFNVNVRSFITRIPFGDQAHFFKRIVLDAIGGYPEIPLFEDVDFMERIRRSGTPVGFAPRAVVSSDRRYRALGYWRTTLRNWELEREWRRGVGADELAARYRRGITSKPDSERTAVIVFHRALREGFVKTRIAKSIGDRATLELYRAFLLDIERTVLSSDATFMPYVDRADDPSALFWPSARGQTGSDLGRRMANAIGETLALGFKKVVLIGSDLPYLCVEDIDNAFGLLSGHDVVFGPATDGGYYLVGVKADSFDPGIFALSSWSHERVLSESREQCESLGLSVGVCDAMTDFDAIEDIEEWFRSARAKKSAPSTWRVWKKIRSASSV